MSLHHAANHLASKGRNGDTTLVHMAPGEVAGLQALAKRNGTSLTINPHTGLPEAFSLKSLLPMAAGAALMATGVGAPMAALLVGGGATLATGSLKQGLLAGLGAYGGAGLASGIGALGAEAGTQAAAGEASAAGEAAAQEAAKQEAAQQVAQQSAQQAAQIGAPGVYAPPATSTPVMTPEIAAEEAAQAANKVGMPTFGAPAGVNGTPFTPATQQALASPMQTGLNAAVSNPGAYVDKLGGGMQAAKYGLAAAAPGIVEDMAPKPYQAPEIKSDSDMGQRYAYESGYDNSIPGRTSQPSYRKISDEEAKKLYGFAAGGDVQYPYGESVVRMADGGTAGYTGNVGDYSAADAAAARGGYGLGIDYSGYDTPVATGSAVTAPATARTSTLTAPAKGVVYDPVSKTFIGPGANAEYLGGGQWGLTAAEQAAADKAAADAAASAFSDSGGGYAAGGNISTLGGYSDGGRLLKGPGDGMSDNIPAQIGSKQPARLADGEFVVPADVVSHLGNGSTDAGAKQLYAMMDRIRKARTGKKKQAPQVSATKAMPA